MSNLDAYPYAMRGAGRNEHVASHWKSSVILTAGSAKSDKIASHRTRTTSDSKTTKKTGDEMLAWIKNTLRDFQWRPATKQSGSANETQDSKQPVNNVWYTDPDGKDIAVVFVHGLNSDSQRCWRADGGRFWPEILKEDSTFCRAAIYLGGYYTGIDSGEYDIAQCSEELLRGLEFARGAGRAPLDFDNICFVCHSLGGIVVRRLIEMHAVRFSEKRIGLVLMASPSMGADYGKFLTAVAALYENKVGIALKAGGRELQDLDDRFRRLLDEKRIQHFCGAEAAEHKSLVAKKYLPKVIKPVVNTASASRYFGNLKIIPRTNHISIVKPDSSEHESHRFLSHFFATRYLPISTERTSGQNHENLTHSTPAQKVSLVSRILFDIYDTSCADYYLIREPDEEFVRKLTLSTVWITGPSASGKTSMARRLIRNRGRAAVEVTLSHCGSHLSEEYCLAEILDTASEARFEGSSKEARTFGELVDVLSKKAKHSDIVLFLDEVPVDSTDHTLIEPFIRFLSDLLDSIKKRAGPDVRFVICSIERPQIGQQYGKLLGQLDFVHLARWRTDEIEALANLICSFLPELKIHRAVMEQAIGDSDGSPRFLKKFLRQLLLVPGANSDEQFRILGETVEHFRAMS